MLTSLLLLSGENDNSSYWMNLAGEYLAEEGKEKSFNLLSVGYKIIYLFFCVFL